MFFFQEVLVSCLSGHFPSCPRVSAYSASCQEKVLFVRRPRFQSPFFRGTEGGTIPALRFRTDQHSCPFTFRPPRSLVHTDKMLRFPLFTRPRFNVSESPSSYSKCSFLSLPRTCRSRWTLLAGFLAGGPGSNERLRPAMVFLLYRHSVNPAFLHF